MNINDDKIKRDITKLKESLIFNINDEDTTTSKTIKIIENRAILNMLRRIVGGKYK